VELQSPCLRQTGLLLLLLSMMVLFGAVGLRVESRVAWQVRGRRPMRAHGGSWLFFSTRRNQANLEALAVHDGRARLIVLLLADPHLLERRERRQDRAADPHRVLALRRRDDLDLHRRRRERRQLLLHAVGDAREHGGAAGEDGVGVEVLTDVDVALHDAVVRRLVDAEVDHRSCSSHHEDQDHRSARAQVLGVDRWIHPRFTLDVPADVDQQARIR